MEGNNSLLFKWVSFKELLFIFLSCSVVAILIRQQDKLELKPVWNTSLNINGYENKRFPTRREKLPLPIVTDLESDGQSDIVMVTPDRMLHVYSRVHSPAYLGHYGVKHTSKNISLPKAIPVVAMATGFIQPYQSMVQVRKQVIAILYSDWTLSCYNHKMKLMWSRRMTDNKESFIMSEGSILISPINTLRPKSGTGTILVGGRGGMREGGEGDSYGRTRRGMHQEQEEQRKLHSLGHYCTYAVDGKSGELSWKHEPGDFEVNPVYDSKISSFSHYKLLLHKYTSHQGEVSWHQYSTAITSVMPHFWTDDSDTKIRLSNFVKDRKKTSEPKVTEHISKVSDLAMGHIAGYAFGGLRPHSSDEHIPDPNVVVIHSMKGIEVLNLKTGRPLFSLPLSSTHAVHGDINADGVVDHVHAVVNPGESYKPGDVVSQHNDIECYGQAVPMYSSSRYIYKHSICKATHWTESFIATEKWIPNLNKHGRKNVNHGTTEPFTPLLIESPSHQHPLKVSSLTRNSSLPLPVGVVYDSIFLLSSGRVTSLGPSGQFNWQMDTASDWDDATEVLYNGDSTRHDDILFVSESFRPTLSVMALKSYGEKSHILAVGWDTVSILDTIYGNILAKYSLPSPPVMKAILADFTDDGTNDIIIVSSERVIGLSLVHHSGFLHTTVLSLFVGLVIVIVAVYTRQKTGFLMPPKEAQD